MQYDLTVKYINGITNLVAALFSRRPVCMTTRAPTFCHAMIPLSYRVAVLVYVGYSCRSHFGEKLRTGRHMELNSAEDDRVWFQTLRELRRRYVFAFLWTEALRMVHHHALIWQGGVNKAVEKGCRFSW